MPSTQHKDLPAAELHANKIDASANAVTVNTTSSQTIDGAATKTLGARWSAIVAVSDGANWQIVNQLGTVS